MDIKKLKKYSKDLYKVDFTIRINKKSVVVKIGGKDNICCCPSIVHAQELALRLNHTIGNIKQEIDEAIILMTKNATQINLFTGGV